MRSHPRVVFAKGTRSVKRLVRAVIYAPSPARAAWIENELDAEDIAIEEATDVKDVIAAVTEGPRPQLLVLDFDSLSGGEILELHSIRERGWFGTLFAIGKVPVSL